MTDEKKQNKLSEAKVDSESVHVVRKGLVSAHDVQQARKEIEKPKESKDK